MKKKVCPYCSCILKAEKEVFGKDTKHSCRGSELAKEGK